MIATHRSEEGGVLIININLIINKIINMIGTHRSEEGGVLGTPLFLRHGEE